ncbi:hypothetical protein CARUB_v10021964mg [Capsella rubella]|uniref:Knottin scorpion toxin-like domain-containing protein n=1 Tax=Capsella rubella TaxID=81985 RepID=R0ICQ3_9BRAS|nr:hypothetical protein CARUB_v10021964mg [Capsella rubella]
MSKAPIVAIFMVILVLGMVTKETQGQELCHEYIELGVPCKPNQCVDACSSKHKNGKGTCMPSSKQCLCTFSCKV